MLLQLNFLYALSEYITLPILALYFHQNLHLPVVQVGILIGIPPLLSSGLGYLAVALTKKLMPISGLIISLCAMILVYSVFMLGPGFWILVLASLLMGLSRGVSQPLTKALFAHHSALFRSPDAAFRLRYLTIAGAATLGPLIVLGLGSVSRRIELALSILTLIIMAVLGIAMRKPLNFQEISLSSVEGFSSWRGHLKTILNPTLILYILAGLLIFWVFSQFETLMPLALENFVTNPQRLFSGLLILNAGLGVVLQTVILFLPKQPPVKLSLYLGNLFFGLAFVAFALAHGHFLLLIFGTVVFSLGEVLAIPGSDIVIDNMSSPDMKVVNFSLAEIRLLGFSLGPVAGSIVLRSFGPQAMFLSSTVLILVGSLLYGAGQWTQTHREAKIAQRMTPP